MADQTVSAKLLDLILGKSQTLNPQTNRRIQKQTIVKRGRKDPGMKNPRGRGGDVPHMAQLMAQPGEMSQERFDELQQTNATEDVARDGAGGFQPTPDFFESDAFRNAITEFFETEGRPPESDEDFAVLMGMAIQNQKGTVSTEDEVLKQMDEGE